MSELENEPVEQAEPEAEQVEPDEELEEQPVEEEAEPEDEEHAEEDVQPEQPAGMTESEIKQAQKKLDDLRKHVAKRMGDILGDDATIYTPCVICGETTPGWMLPPQLAPPDPETVATLRVYIGMPNLDQFEQAPDATGCPDCKAMGWVKTGSTVENFTVKQCSRCAGKGYIGTGITVLPETGFAANGATDPAPVAAAPPLETDLPPELEAYRQQGWMIVAPFSAAPG